MDAEKPETTYIRTLVKISLRLDYVRRETV